MASSRWGRFFGRRTDDDTTASPSIPGPRPPAAYVPYGPQPGAPYAPGTAEPPVVARGRLAEATRRRRAADGQVQILERFEAKLSVQVHEAAAAERHDYEREIIQRRLAVRARLEESTYRRGLLRAEEDRLTAELARVERQPVR